MPSWRPFARPVLVVPVTTRPVPLQVGLAELTTLDGWPVGPLTLWLVVRFDPVDRFAAVAALAAASGPRFGERLLPAVRAAVDGAVRAAVQAATLAQLRRDTLHRVLADRWLPGEFAAGALLRTWFEVRAAA